MTSDGSINKNTCMKKNVIITIIIVLVLSVIYSNTSKHVSQFLWKYNDSDFSGSYEDVLIFKDGNDVYRYEWPYIYKYDKRICNMVFCIGDRMWVNYQHDSTETKFIEYVGK